MDQKNSSHKKNNLQVQGEKKLKPPHINLAKNIDDVPSKNIPDIDRLVDDIILKYSDFGITDRD